MKMTQWVIFKNEKDPRGPQGGFRSEQRVVLNSKGSTSLSKMKMTQWVIFKNEKDPGGSQGTSMLFFKNENDSMDYFQK